MTNNDYLRSIRYILNVNDQQFHDLLKLGGETEANIEDVKDFLRHEEDEQFLKCDDQLVHALLDGVITSKRGKDDNKTPPPNEYPMSNNIVLKKLKVAFALKEDEMHETLALAGFKIGRSELSAFLRKKGHENYRECGDQFLRNFLKGLSLRKN